MLWEKKIKRDISSPLIDDSTLRRIETGYKIVDINKSNIGSTV